MSDQKLRVILEAKADKLIKSLDKSSAKLQQFGDDANRIGKRLTVGLSAPIALAGVKAISSAAKFEKLQTQLNVLTGSADKGAEAFKKLVDFSAGTPFQLDELVQANNTLMGFGVSAGDAFKHLQSIGDIAAVSGGDLQGISVAFGQVAASGRLMGQDLLQLINNGVPIIDMLSQSMGVAKSEVKDMVSEGAVTFPVLIKAFQDATSEGGKFAGGMALLSGTLGGVFSTLKDNINIAFAEVGKSIVESFNLIEVTKGIISKIQSWTAAFKEFSPTAKKVVLVVAGLAAAIGPLLIGLSALPKILTAVSTGIKVIKVAMLALSSPVGLIIAGLTAIGVLIYKNWDKIEPVLVNIYNKFVDLYNSSTVLRGVIGGLKGVFKAVFTAVKGYISIAVNVFKSMGKLIKAIVTGDFKNIGGIIKEAVQSTKDKYIDTGKEMATNVVDGIKSGIDSQLEYKTVGSVKEGLQKAVDKAAEQVTIPALGGGGRQKATTVSGLGATAGTAIGTTQKLNLDPNSSLLGQMQTVTTDPAALLAQSVSNSNGVLRTKLGETAAIISEAAVDISPHLENMAVGIGEALGNALVNGGNLIGALGGVLLTGLGDIAIELGKTAIGIGVAMKAIKMSFKNPATAIAAGIALVAIGTMIKSVVPGIVKGKGGGAEKASGPRSGAVAAFANGGIVSGPTLGLMGEYAGARSNPEVIAPLDRLKNIIGDRQAQQVNVGGEFRLQGQDLVVALQRAEKQRGRIK